jgi:hypothetical protein
VSAADDADPIGDTEADRLFADLVDESAPCWRYPARTPPPCFTSGALAKGTNRPRSFTPTVDHGLRPQSAAKRPA